MSTLLHFVLQKAVSMTTTYKRSSTMQARLEQNKKAIFQAARTLVAKGGFKEAQMVAIAEEAGVSTGLIYRYYPNKHELLVEILAQANQQEVDILNAIIARQDEDVVHKLRSAVMTFVCRALSGPHLAYAFIAEPVDTYIEGERLRCRRLLSNTFKTLLLLGMAEKTFAIDDVDTTCACIVGSMLEGVISPVTPSTETIHDKVRLASWIADFCVNAVCKQPQP